MLTGFLKNIKENSQNTAIITAEKSLSYAQLNELALGIHKEIDSTQPLIGFYTSEDEFPYIAILSILYVGKGFVPLNYKFPEQRLNAIIESTEIDQVICRAEDKEKLTALIEYNNIKIISTKGDKVEGCKDDISINPNALAYILFTSGSTGVPKGIPINFYNLQSLIDALMIYFPDNINSVLQAFEFSFDVSIACTFFAWEKGACLHSVKLSGIIPLNTYKILTENNTEFVTLPPSSAIFMDKFNILDKGPVNILHTIFTGEALAYNVVNKWKKFGSNSHIYNAYGPTENTVWSFIYKCNEYTENELINGLVPIGEPLSNFEYIIEGTNNEGELYTYGPQVAKGYWKNEEKTSNTFINRNNKIWYKSGDWVIKNRRNQVVYINRIDNQVQVNGYRVEIGEIEFKAKELFNTDLIAVVPNQKENGLIELILFIASKDKDEKLLLASLNKVLPPYMVPNSIKVLDSIPINNSGKIDRKTLIALIN